MRIEPRQFGSKDRLKKPKTDEKSGITFMDALKDIDNDTGIPIDIDNLEDGDLKNLTGLIEQEGEGLSQNPTPENFNRYKKYIKLFITILQDNFEIKDTISRISFSKQKLYKTVESIDSNLTELARMVLSNEKNRMNYLKLVNNIKGLIIDLTL